MSPRPCRQTSPPSLYTRNKSLECRVLCHRCFFKYCTFLGFHESMPLYAVLSIIFISDEGVGSLALDPSPPNSSPQPSKSRRPRPLGWPTYSARAAKQSRPPSLQETILLSAEFYASCHRCFLSIAHFWNLFRDLCFAFYHCHIF